MPPPKRSAERPFLHDLAQLIGNWLDTAASIFYIDLRSLAVFRGALGFILVWDLMELAKDFRCFLTDDGAMPRELIQKHWQTRYGNAHHNMSLHMASAAQAWQALLLVAHAIAAVAFALGYRTRAASVACWFLLQSLHLRVPFLNHGGDTLLRILFFWLVFLPSNEVWSLDRNIAVEDARRAARGARPPVRDAAYWEDVLSDGLHRGRRVGLAVGAGLALILFVADGARPVTHRSFHSFPLGLVACAVAGALAAVFAGALVCRGDVGTARTALPRKHPTVSGAPTMGFFVQIFLLYMVNGMMKTGELWHSGDAIAASLKNLPHLAKQPQAAFLASHAAPLRAMGGCVRVLEFYAPLVLLVPGAHNTRCRLGAIVAFVGLHTGFAFFMELGHFPYTCVALWLPVIPSYFWEWAADAAQQPALAAPDAIALGRRGGVRGGVHGGVPGGGRGRRVRFSWAAQLSAMVLTVIILNYNVSGFDKEIGTYKLLMPPSQVRRRKCVGG